MRPRGVVLRRGSTALSGNFYSAVRSAIFSLSSPLLNGQLDNMYHSIATHTLFMAFITSLLLPFLWQGKR